MFGRKWLTKVLTVVSVIGALVIAFVAGTGSTASATQGQAVIAGMSNGSTASTIINNGGTGTGLTENAGLEAYAISSTTGVALVGWGTASGVCAQAGGSGSTPIPKCDGTFAGDAVHGEGVQNGVSGNAAGGNGVFGTGLNGVSGTGAENGVQATGGTFGVFASGTDYGVYGSAPNHGVYGTATTNSGAGIEAQAASASGIGLRVTGKVQLSRSGTATITGTSTTPLSSIVISNVAVSGKSLVLATPQKNVAGVWVQAAVPNASAKTITIYLNKTVAVSYPVAWMVIERP